MRNSHMQLSFCALKTLFPWSRLTLLLLQSSYPFFVVILKHWEEGMGYRCSILAWVFFTLLFCAPWTSVGLCWSQSTANKQTKTTPLNKTKQRTLLQWGLRDTLIYGCKDESFGVSLILFLLSKIVVVDIPWHSIKTFQKSCGNLFGMHREVHIKVLIKVMCYISSVLVKSTQIYCKN